MTVKEMLMYTAELRRPMEQSYAEARAAPAGCHAALSCHVSVKGTLAVVQRHSRRVLLLKILGEAVPALFLPCPALDPDFRVAVKCCPKLAVASRRRRAW